MDSRIVAVVPIRSLTDGKSRLAATLSPDQRSMLIERMVRHVVRAARDSHALGAVAVISPDPAVLRLVADLGPGVFPLSQDDERPGLIPALNQARDWVTTQGASAMLTLFGDLPLLSPDEVRNVVRRDAPVVLAPDRHGTGTNALLLRLTATVVDDVRNTQRNELGALQRSTCPFQFQFGPDSYARHLAEADRLGWDAATALMSGMALDLDTPADLAALSDHLVGIAAD